MCLATELTIKAQESMCSSNKTRNFSSYIVGQSSCEIDKGEFLPKIKVVLNTPTLALVKSDFLQDTDSIEYCM